MSFVTKKVIFPLKEISAFARASVGADTIELDVANLDTTWDWFYLSKTKKPGAYFVHTTASKDTMFIVGISHDPSSVVTPKIYMVKFIDRWGSVATVHDPLKMKMTQITLIELYMLYGFFIGNLSTTHKPKLIKKQVGQ